MFIPVLICKVLHFIGALIGKGSSMPGKIVMKLFPNALSKIKMPENVVAVTGSNGKSSTTGMIAHILEKNGKKVVWNREGSNQTEGIATALFCACNLKGEIGADAVILESDERYARHTFRHFSPKYFLVTNLYRDQMTRNGHQEWIYDIISDAISDDMTLILNADSSIVSRFGIGRSCIYYSMDRNEYSSETHMGRYDDGMFCPVCKHKMEYSYYTVSDCGKYKCAECGFSSPDAKYRVTGVDIKNGTVTFDGGYTSKLSFNGLYNIYNMLASYTVCREIGLSPADIADALSSFTINNGRVFTFGIEGKNDVFLISKHENSISYNSSIDYVVRSGLPTDVLVMVNSISRKYYTGETSWLYDIDFERLGTDSVRRIVLCGKYCRDLRLRFTLAGLENKITVIENPDEAVAEFVKGENNIVFMTCFADRARLEQAVRGLDNV